MLIRLHFCFLIRFLILLFIIEIINVDHLYGQNRASYEFGQNFEFDMIFTDSRTLVTQPLYIPVSDTALYQIFEYSKNNKHGSYVPRSPIMLGVKLNSSLTKYYASLVQSISKHYQTFVIADSSDAVLIALGINAENVDNYRYHVVENDSKEIVPWSPIPRLEQRYGAKKLYGFIGKYNAPGRRLMIEVVNKNDFGTREGVIFDWRMNFKPILSQLLITTPNEYYNLKRQRVTQKYATKFDRMGIPSDFKFPPDSVLGITLQLEKQETLVQAVYLISHINGKTDTSKRLGFVDQYGFYELDRSYFANSGRYELIIKRQEKEQVWDNDRMLLIPFEVLPHAFLSKNFSIQQMLPYLGGILVLFLSYLWYNKLRLIKIKQQQETAQLKLKSLRSQLNPHFMFNALSAIQNLMNKNKLLEANHYLSKFAGLTRNVLNTTEKDTVTLQEELKIAEDYLQMEQLRFGFKYQLEVDPRLDQFNTDIPAMLLQPFIENAVKHGISKMQDQGIIKLSTGINENDIWLSVEDNGTGFDHTKTMKDSSFGLKLSEERIRLLNHIHREQGASLTIDSKPGRTVVTILLIKWI